MSVLIKGMEMPKTCEECALNYDSYACIKTGSRFFRDKDSEFDPFKARLEDCPLAPVPPHGRLGDLDSLELKMRNRIYKYGRESDPACLVVDAPTIIPAEEETT